MNSLELENLATTPWESPSNASDSPHGGNPKIARGGAPGTRSPKHQALKGRATENFGRPWVRPFRAWSGMTHGPKALPWAAMKLPLWGANGCTATKRLSSLNANRDVLTTLSGPCPHFSRA